MRGEEILESLHPLERKVLPILTPDIDLKTIANVTKLKEVEVMRALQWLENKGIIKIKHEVNEYINLDVNGKKYLEEGLPEKRFLNSLDSEMSINQVLEKSKLSKEELNVCLGALRKKAAIFIAPNRNIKITEQGKKYLDKESLEEKFLKKLPVEEGNMLDEDRFAYEELKKRKKIIKKTTDKIKKVEITELGKGLLMSEIDNDYIDSLTPKMIKEGSWKEKKFRRYDVAINVPSIQFGKRHFVNHAIEYAKRVWMDLGFKEMTGNILQTSFWNFDSLFTPQDHPVREMQDTFYVKNPATGKLPDKRIWEEVKKTHENGGKTGSKGWNYQWQEKEALKNVLRTHTTVLSAQTLAQIKKDGLPAKYFSVGKCFRNETLDWSHLFEFNQTEGIVIDPNANFKHLLGYLKEFFRKMGYPKARFRPAYFPYTEMSVEIDVYHPIKKKWLELGGAGMFRPEVVVPLLGEDVPVLAWGPGFDRIIMDDYNITDLRELYNNDIKKLREMKLWLR